MGLPPCGFKITTGLPCATCGMTTAFSHTANCDLIKAFTVQPTGTVLALFTAVVAIFAALAVVFGFSLAPLGYFVSQPRTVIAFAALLLAGWAYTLLLTLWF